MIDEPWEPQGATNMPDTSNDPEYIRVPITDPSVKVGSIIMWRGLPCPVQAVTPAGTQHTCINVLYDSKIATGVYENWEEIHVKRPQEGR